MFSPFRLGCTVHFAIATPPCPLQQGSIFVFRSLMCMEWDITVTMQQILFPPLSPCNIPRRSLSQPPAQSMGKGFPAVQKVKGIHRFFQSLQTV